MDALAMIGKQSKIWPKKPPTRVALGRQNSLFLQPARDNPFMAGAIHGIEEADAVLNVGVSGPGVIARALERLIENTLNLAA